MKSNLLTLIAPLLAITGPIHAAPPATDPSIILGSESLPRGVTKYAAWPSLSDPCTSATIIASKAPKDQGLFGHPFTVGTNPNFTNVEAEPDFNLPIIVPVKAGASPPQLCIALSPNNTRTCPRGRKRTFSFDFLCGGPLTTG
ncbi:hypothetical protein G7Y79_00050g085960 [Physcia stellaris]|nr:hypothetical protein G7Y79_00050g085960 [Physcia stellaris]